MRHTTANIDELAYKQLTVHQNDLSMGLLSRMLRTFGRVESQLAIERAMKLCKLVDIKVPDKLIRKINNQLNGPLKGTITGRATGPGARIQQLKPRPTNQITGKAPTLVVIDEWG